MEERVRVLLGAASSAYSDAEVSEALVNAQAFVEGYCNREINDDVPLTSCVVRIAVIYLNRRNSEGLTGTSAGGVSENYLDGIPADVKAVLKMRRRATVL